MARFELELPKEIYEDLKAIYDNADHIFGEMTLAGAQVAAENVRKSVPIEAIAKYVKISKTYKTPSDGGINTKVYIDGYLPLPEGRKSFTRMAKGKRYTTTKGIPVAFIVNMYEYGRSHPDFPKRPFFRSSFKKGEITKAMLKKQKEMSGGLLDE